MANAKERSYEVRFAHPNYPLMAIDALTPERAANSVAHMHPAFEVHISGVLDVGTGELVELVGRCQACKSWIRKTDKYIDSPNHKGFDCGECRPNARYNLERAGGSK